MSISGLTCRFCGHPVTQSFADLGTTPLANDYLPETQLTSPESFYPLHAGVCDKCFLVQIPAFETPSRIFSDYAYFSSYADSWVEHARHYAHAIQGDLKLNAHSKVIEVASNDGYLLKHFKALGIPVLGVEPAANVAQVAQEAGIPTEVRFFGVEFAKELVKRGEQADLLIGNNVLAHVPDLNDFVAGLNIALKPEGRITIEFPHLLKLIQFNQFDTIYHEHFSYLSLLAVEKIFKHHHLTLVDVEELTTHGGSLRIHMAHRGTEPAQDALKRIKAVRDAEHKANLHKLETYAAFEAKVREIKNDTIQFLLDIHRQGKTIAGYGAPAKGNTMLNYCGIRSDLLPYTVDRSPHKQNHYLPGSRIPILAPEAILERKPDYVWILPWNLKDEITKSMAAVRDWGGQFVTAIPSLTVF